ncbi:MAG TPA: MBL fold metallo-hydrolase [Stellaceae bacterium]|nr:MBL fold metallo-hydrolase [Stellaceae bacterium]
MRLSFHGADRGVTGSCHLVECHGRRILIDCGLLQGSRELAEENAEPFGFEAREIDCVLLTHAHLDHCGRLPLLAKRGFRGEVIATAATFELARLVLIDAAHLQGEEARRQARHRHGHAANGAAAPLYTLLDALNSFERFGRTASYETKLPIAPGISATFFDAGHILGSASILLEIDDGASARSVLFSGDIGNAGRPLLRPPSPPPSAEIIVMESTYGDRLHRPLAASIDELYAAISDAFGRSGNVVIPTFALERAQEILYFLHQGIETNKLPPTAPVFLDSPMAISATEIFEHHPECLEPAVAQLFRQGRDPLHLPGLHLAREAAESMAINRITGGAIVMAGSGMCTGGRVRHHLRHNLWREEAAVIFVGFAAARTLARQIIDGAQEVNLFGEAVPVRAHIHTINGFSAHADQRELLAWHGSIKGSKITFLVHGEEPVMTRLAGQLPGQRVEMPQPHEAFEL